MRRIRILGPSWTKSARCTPSTITTTSRSSTSQIKSSSLLCGTYQRDNTKHKVPSGRDFCFAHQKEIFSDKFRLLFFLFLLWKVTWVAPFSRPLAYPAITSAKSVVCCKRLGLGCSRSRFSADNPTPFTVLEWSLSSFLRAQVSGGDEDQNEDDDELQQRCAEKQTDRISTRTPGKFLPISICSNLCFLLMIHFGGGVVETGDVVVEGLHPSTFLAERGEVGRPYGVMYVFSSWGTPTDPWWVVRFYVTRSLDGVGARPLRCHLFGWSYESDPEFGAPLFVALLRCHNSQVGSIGLPGP